MNKLWEGFQCESVWHNLILGQTKLTVVVVNLSKVLGWTLWRLKLNHDLILVKSCFFDDSLLSYHDLQRRALYVCACGVTDGSCMWACALICIMSAVLYTFLNYCTDASVCTSCISISVVSVEDPLENEMVHLKGFILSINWNNFC